jgi:predicted dehydrogenase
MKRRNFLDTTTKASLGFSVLPILPTLSKAKNYKLAIIGAGWWGMNILREAMAYGDSEVVAVCDVDQRTLNSVRDELDQLTGKKPKIFTDYRELIQKTKPDLVIIATPDHWHALPAIEAIKSGAHVFLEKPIGHTINEGKAILKAARNYQRVVQVDTHRRVSPHNIEGMDFIRAGNVGEISSIKCFVNYGQGPGKMQTPEEVPKELDWDMWYANGMIGDWGIHWFDQVLWWSEEQHPKKIFSTGGRFVKEDSTDAPDTQYALYEFEGFTLHWEHKLTAKNAYEKTNVGAYFYGTKGTFHMGWRDGWTFYPSNNNQSIIHKEPTLNEPDHQNIKELWADFIHAIENETRPACDIEGAHNATNISLLGMLSYKLGRSIEWDGEKGMVLNDDAANKLLSRAYRGDWEYPA